MSSVPFCSFGMGKGLTPPNCRLNTFRTSHQKKTFNLAKRKLVVSLPYLRYSELYGALVLTCAAPPSSQRKMWLFSPQMNELPRAEHQIMMAIRLPMVRDGTNSAGDIEKWGAALETEIDTAYDAFQRMVSPPLLNPLEANALDLVCTL